MSDLLLQNHMSTSHTIRAHAQELWDKSSERKVTHNSKSDLPLVVYSRLHNAFPHVSQRIAVVSDVRSDLTHANMF